MAKDKDEYGFAGDLVPQGTFKKTFQAIYTVCAIVAVVYGVCVIQYGLVNMFGAHGPFKGTDWAFATDWVEWNDYIFAPITGIEYFKGKGSTTLAQEARYGRNWYFMTPHMMAGGIMILCSIVLMNPKLRYGKYAKWHRIAGDVYVVAHLFSLYGSFGFLFKHTFHQGVPQTYPENFEESISHGGIFGGSIFTLLLWMYWLAGAVSLGMGVFHIMKGEVQRHRSWMSVNYGTTMGAAGLRINWAIAGYFFPQYRQDEVNSACVIAFIIMMYWAAAGHASLAHRKEYACRGCSPIFTVAFITIGLGCVALIRNQSQTATFDSNDWAHNAAFNAHLASWSIGLLVGSILLPRILHTGNRSESGFLGYTFVGAGICIFVTSSSLFNPPASFSCFLWAKTGEGHFYKLFFRTIWDLRALSVLVKTFIFGLAMRAKDEARIVEWSIHSYGEMVTYGLALAVLAASRTLFPSDEDARAHAELFACLAGPLVANIASIYVMKPEPQQISAVRNGMFWDLRGRPVKASIKSD